jgi:SagB-type dehydrogenase family enzyme
MKLPRPDRKGAIPLERAIDLRASRRAFEDSGITLAQLSQLLWCAQGEVDGGGRAVPSAGATFPLEVYAVAGRVEGLAAGLYRYDGGNHSIELTVEGDLRSGLAKAALSQGFIVRAPATIVIAADYERTAGRYGGRAERYVHMEVGHAGQNIYLQCEALGLATCAVGAFDDASVKRLLRMDEEPLYLMPVGRGS